MIRVGLGYDIHRLVPGRSLTLGGVRFASEVGLDGHSDADVVIHALMDALLGAIALGDIGQHFPPGDPQYRNASSLQLLTEVYRLISSRDWHIVNADVVVVAEQPHIAPYEAQMRQNIAEALHLSAGAISIKATTNEQVGAEGRGEAISAQAVALLEGPA